MQDMADRTPVLIGAGQFTYRGDPATSPSPTALLKIAADRARHDAGLADGALAGIDGLAVMGFAVDAEGDTRVIPHSKTRRRPLQGDWVPVRSGLFMPKWAAIVRNMRSISLRPYRPG